jgi:hypothetical protein
MRRIPGRVFFSFPLLRLREWKHSLFYPKCSEIMTQALERFRRCPARLRKSPSRIRREKRLCRNYWKCRPLHYYRYDLYRRDKPLDEDSLLDYIPEFFFYRVFLPLFDLPKYQILLEDKLLTEEVFRALGIPQPFTLGKLVGGRLYSRYMEETEYPVFQRKLGETACSKVFIKPAGGRGGDGIFIFLREADGGFRDGEGRLLDGDFLAGLGRARDFLIQAGVIQAGPLSGYYPHSVNTFRVATENHKGRVRVLCATLRMGRGGNQVDNSAQGGLVLGINTETGLVREKAHTEACESFDRHPDTGFLFKGQRIPEWDRIRAFALRSAAKLSRFCYLGWDIALADDGPLALETNLQFGLDHYQAAIGGLRGIFRIRRPDGYWYRRARLGRESG